MSKTKKRYETSQAITRKIDAEKQRAIDLLAESESHLATFKHIQRLNPTMEDGIEAMHWEKKQATKKKKQSARIIDVLLPKLSAKLAEFNTNLLFGDDRSVPVK